MQMSLQSYNGLVSSLCFNPTVAGTVVQTTIMKDELVK